MPEVECLSCGYQFYKPDFMVSVSCPNCGATNVKEKKA